jgi:cytidine deaminase
MPHTASDGGAGPLSPAAARDLLEQARAARANAYAPYSHFPVGAALLAIDGRVFTGVNVENASYGLSTCAERTAVVCAMAAGARDFVAVAVAGPEDRLRCPPCGSCRQILHEASPDLVVVTAREDGGPAITSLRDLLPGPFDGAAVRRERPLS